MAFGLFFWLGHVCITGIGVALRLCFRDWFISVLHYTLDFVQVMQHSGSCTRARRISWLLILYTSTFTSHFFNRLTSAFKY